MRPIQVLILEDKEADALLMVENLRQADFDPKWKRVDNQEAFLAALETPPELILSDYSLPQFNAEAAFQLFKAKNISIPFLIVSGAIPDDKGVYLMREGVDDFILKDHLSRLGEAVKHALERKNLIKEKKNAEIALRASEERFRNAFNFAASGIALVSLDGRFLQVNRALCEILDLPENVLLQKSLQEICAQDEFTKIREALKALADGAIKEFQVEVPLMKTWTLFSGSVIKNEKSAPIHYICQIQDITQKKLVEEKLLNLAHYDTITALPNRRMIEGFLDQALLSASLANKKIATFLVYIDQIKLIDESLGSFVSDNLLKIIASRFQNSLPNKDIVGSWARGKFVIVFSNIKSTESLLRFAEKIQEVIKDPITAEGNQFFTTCSVGVAVYPDDADRTHSLLKNADIAMNRARSLGGGSYQPFAKEMCDQVEEHLQYQFHLNRALKHQEFTLHYQPVICFEKKKIVSSEALIRWNSKDKGSISPEKFIPIAEESNLIASIGEWVLRKACQDAMELVQQGCPLLTFSVNVSSRELRNPQFVTLVDRILQETKLPAEHLRLEITERQLMENLKEILNTLKGLQERGIQIAIDDFGVAYSCFEYLKIFAANRLKIDKSFVHDIHNNDRERAIVSAMILLSRELKVPCIAEGVETQEEFQFLRGAGCNECQGYFFSPPVPLDAFKKLLQSNLSVAKT